MLEQVGNYIDENILHSAVWDNADEKTRKKAINNSIRTFNTFLKKYYKDEIPVDHLSEQVLWMLKIDDSVQRAELGMSYIQVDGVSINISEMDRTICPYVCKVLNVPVGFLSRRRVGSYALHVSDTSRGGCRCMGGHRGRVGC